MRIAMLMNWEGVTQEQYDQVRSIVNWESDIPNGAVLHVATHDGNALRVTDVWESGEALNNFVQDRLMPGVAKVGITSQPKIEVYPVHAIFTPAFRPIK